MKTAKLLFDNPSLLEFMPTAVYIIDAKGLIHGFNQRACEFWGRVPKLYDHDNRFCGAFKLYTPDGTVLEHDKTPMSAAIDWGLSFKNVEVIIQRPDGTQITVMVNICPLKDENGTIIGAINSFQDISEIIQARKKIEEHQKELEQRDAFLSICSHELKTPLTILLTQAQLALKKISMNNELVLDREVVKTMLEKNQQQFLKLNHLIDDMLDLRRIKSGKLTMHFEKIDLAELIKEIISNTFYGLDQALGKFVIRSIEPLKGFFDRFRMEQVINNLLVNAIKYGGENFIEIEIGQKNEMAKIQIRDTGAGINQKDHFRIFEQYTQVGNEESVSGLGIGLFVTKEIVNAHQGIIYVESILGKGSNFILELPLLSSYPS
jgi:signal transduction histidine kinase